MKITSANPFACSIPDCLKPSGRRGEPAPCSMHRARIARHGNPSTRLKIAHTMTARDYLDAHVPHRPDGDCWVWTGPIDKNGYGVANAPRPSGKRGPARAHRVIYEALVGPIPDGKLLMHACDNPPCVNPAHLTPASDAENLADMARKGRSARGSRHRAAKLTEAQVMEVRTKYATGRYTLRVLAAEYGLTLTPMSQLVRGVTWKHLPLVDRKAA